MGLVVPVHGELGPEVVSLFNVSWYYWNQAKTPAAAIIDKVTARTPTTDRNCPHCSEPKHDSRKSVVFHSAVNPAGQTAVA